MQFTNTSGVTSQTDTNQHNAGGELHARLRNDEQHTSTPGPAGVEGAGGAGGPDRRAGGRRRILSTHKRQARPIGGAAGPAGPGRGAGGRWWRRTAGVEDTGGPGRGAGGRRQGLAGLRDRPLRAQLACGDLAGGPLPTGTHSGPAQQNWPRGGRAWPGFEKTRRANHQHTRLHWCGGHRGPGRGAGGRWWRRTAGVEDTGGRPRCRWAAAGPGRASRSTTPSEARVWRSRGRDAAHRHQHAGTNTQPQIHRHNEAARPHRGRAAHASGR